MAEKYLRSITFPGLSDTYIIPEPDANLETTGVPADAKATGDALDTKAAIADVAAAFESVDERKANIDGSYDLMNTGTSDNWTPYSSDSGATQDIPFLTEGTGCGNGESVVDTGSYLQLKKKLGNTGSVNQLINPITSTATINNVSVTATGNKYAFSGTATGSGGRLVPLSITDFNIISGHKYLILASGDFRGLIFLQSRGTSISNVAFSIGSSIVTPNISFSDGRLGVNVTQDVYYSNTLEIYVIDLTLWFGSNDAIPSHLLSHPEDWGRYYSGSLAYDAGHLENADGSILTSLPRNLFDKSQTMVNANVGTDGSYTTNANTKSIWMPCIPNTEYHFFKSKGARFNAGSAPTQITSGYFSAYGTSTSNNSFTLTTGASDRYILVWFYNSAIDTGLTADEVAATVCVSLYYPGESGYDQYYPFSVLAEVDTGSEVLRGVEGSRDEKLPSGAITRRRKSIDLGTLNYQSGTPGLFFSDPLADTPEFNVSTTDPKAINPKYIYAASAYGNVTNDKVFCINGGRIWIVDTAYSDVATFKAAMSGVMFEYPLATPTTEQGTAFAENIPCDDFGSLMWTQTKGIPQGNEIFYPVDYKASIDTLYNRVEGDMSKIVIDTELGAVADRIPEAPDADGTYTLKATVSSGTKTYSWVADE